MTSASSSAPAAAAAPAVQLPPPGTRVGLNLIFLVPGETGGMEIYARELIPALLTAAPELRFTAFINREAAGASDAPWRELLPLVKLPVRARSRPQWVLAEQTLLPAAAMRARVALVHSLAATAPLWGRFRRVTTVHDLIYMHHPDAHPGLRDRGMRALVPAAARRSERVIADSQSTRSDLVELLGLAAERIDVVLLGLGARPAADALSAADTRARFELGERRVLLSLSAKRPHKNLAALIGALALIEPAQRPLLVLPGYPTWHESQLRARAEQLGLSADVRFLAWIEPDELEGLWALAHGFVFPSLYEGFGLPVLEAMARGVPVACSETSALGEVAGDAALLFDPCEERSIAAAIERLLALEGSERERLIARGRARAGQFSWEQTARGTLASYARALSGSSRSPVGWVPPPSEPSR